MSRRIQKELRDLESNPIEGITAEPVGDDLFHWSGSVRGPSNTPYEGGTFYIDITFPDDYPDHGPAIIFTTRIYHPNVNEKGGVCLDIFKDKWTPEISLSVALQSVYSLLGEPNPYDPFAPEIAKNYIEDKDGFIKIAREWTEQYAK